MTSLIWIGPAVGLLVGYFLAGGGVIGVVGSVLGGWLGHQFDSIIQLSSSVYPAHLGVGGDLIIEKKGNTSPF